MKTGILNSRDIKTGINVWDSDWQRAHPLPKTNESDTVQMYRNIFYLGNKSQNRSVSKIDSREHGSIHSPPSPKIAGGEPSPWAPLV